MLVYPTPPSPPCYPAKHLTISCSCRGCRRRVSGQAARWSHMSMMAVPDTSTHVVVESHLPLTRWNTAKCSPGSVYMQKCLKSHKAWKEWPSMAYKLANETSEHMVGCPQLPKWPRGTLQASRVTEEEVNPPWRYPAVSLWSATTQLFPFFCEQSARGTDRELEEQLRL